MFPHQLRDADAFVELAAVLQSIGYIYGGLILNTPAPVSSSHVDTSFLKPCDLLVSTTRPPLDDEVGGDKRTVKRSHTPLEEQVFAAVRGCFEVCTRSHVKLSKFLAFQLGDSVRNKGEIQFRQYAGASYMAYKRYEDFRWETLAHSSETAAYLVCTSRLWKNGPRLLNTFGMGGLESLIWTYLLRKKYWHELKIDVNIPRFIMVEMTERDIPNSPSTLAFADDWPVKILINAPLQMTPQVR